MSKYEWERGTIKLSCVEYRRVKREMIRFFQIRTSALFDKAISLWRNILDLGKGKRKFNFRSQFYPLAQRVGVRTNDDDLICNSLFPDSERTRPLKPKKQDFRVKVDRKNFRINRGEFTIAFLDDKHSIHWGVQENNHALEFAHGDPVAQELFRLLGGVKWTRGTGGKIVGNDEYNQDSSYEGGGGNYVTREFGPHMARLRDKLGSAARSAYSRV